MLGWWRWRTQIEQRHHPLGTLVVDAQTQGYPAMSIGGMVTMDGFNLVFERQVFGRLPLLTIDVFPTNAQRIAALFRLFLNVHCQREFANQALQFFVLTFQLVEFQH